MLYAAACFMLLHILCSRCMLYAAACFLLLYAAAYFMLLYALRCCMLHIAACFMLPQHALCSTSKCEFNMKNYYIVNLLNGAETLLLQCACMSNF